MRIFCNKMPLAWVLTVSLAVAGCSGAPEAQESDQLSAEEMARSIAHLANRRGVPDLGPGTDVSVYADGAAVVREIRLTEPALARRARANRVEMLNVFGEDYRNEVCSSRIASAFVRSGVVYRMALASADGVEIARLEVTRC